MNLAASLNPYDLLRMPDEGQGFELVDGELRELKRSKESFRIAGKIGHELLSYVQEVQPGWVFGSGLGYCCFPIDSTRVRRADASYIALDRMPVETYEDEGHTTTVPDLVAEVVSPNDLADEVEAKLDDWLGAGVKIVWIVNPGTQTVRIHRLDGGYSFLHAKDILTAEGVLPGFACPVSNLFRKPG